MALSSQAFASAIRKHYPSLVVPTKVPKAFWGRLGKTIKEAGYTVEDAEKLGFWLSNQKWITEPMSILTVALKGGEWLAKIDAKRCTVKKDETEWVNLDGLI